MSENQNDQIGGSESEQVREDVPAQFTRAAPVPFLSCSEKMVCMVVFVILVAVRIPSVWQGRFWAEEGTIFFSHACHTRWYQALLFSYGGYLNLAANLGGVLARHLVPIEKACYVTSTFGLLIQSLPAAILCLSKDRWLQNRFGLISALLVTATLPMSQEIWLSSIGSQCHLNLCVALILSLDTTSTKIPFFIYGTLVFAGLSGPGAVFLAPLFFARCWLEKSRTRLMQALTLSVGCALQFIFFYHPEERVVSGLGKSAQSVGIDPLLFLNICFEKHILGPFLGMQRTEALTRNWWDAAMHGRLSPVPAVCVIIVLFLLCYVAWRSKKIESRWLVTAGAILCAIANIGALGDRMFLLIAGTGERYVFAPQILFELSLLPIVFGSSGWLKRATTVTLCWLLIVAGAEYFLTPAVFSEGPAWNAEINLWKKDRSYKPRVWPPFWRVDLSM
jgi:hypothetical protein